jgi:hypothetical protein
MIKSPAISTLRWSLLLALLSACHLARAQSYPPAWSGAASYVIGDQTQASGNVYRCIKAVAFGLSPAQDYTNWELYYVRANTTLTIGALQPFPSLKAAWTYAQNAKVADGAYLHFYMSSAHSGPYSESFAAPLLLDHSSGARIAILGDGATDTLSFGATNGIIIDTGHSLNTISSLTISGAGTDGVKVDFAASLSNLSACTVTGFNNGVHALQGGSVSISGGNFSSIHDNCCWAESSGNITVASGLTISGINTTSEVAFSADLGGSISAEYATVGNVYAGATAENGGVIDVRNSTISSSNYGADANGGFVTCSAACITNCTCGIYAQYGGQIIADQCLVSSCEYGAAAYSQAYVNCEDANFWNNSLDLQVSFNGVIDAVLAVVSTQVITAGSNAIILT